MTILHDLRYALRTLKKSPGFSMIAVATLGLGIGANTAIFSVVYGVLLRPLPFRQPERLVALEERDRNGSPDNTGYPTYLDWRAKSRSFEDIAVMSYWTPRLGAARGASAETLEGLRVSDGFLRLLGVRMAQGRDFLPSEDRTGNNRVVILSDGLWKRRFGADPTLPGKTIILSDTPYLVAGVLPPDFEPVFSQNLARPAEIWSPLGYNLTQPWACRSCRHLRAIGRLKPGTTLGQARAEMNAISLAIVRQYPTEYGAAGIFATPFSEALTGRARPALLTLLAAVGFVLLIGCANVASLLMSRAVRRRKEIALRTALGASRARIASLFLAESVVLALAGGVLGLLAADATLQTLVSLAPGDLPRVAAVRLDGAVLLVTLGVSVVTGLLFGIVPALRLSRLDPEPELRGAAGASAGPRSRRLAGSLVVFDVALALVLLSGALLLLKSASRVLHIDPGFRSDELLTMEIDVSGIRYREDASVRIFYDRVLERVAALPGVKGVGLASQLPLGGNIDRYGIHAEDKPSPNPEQDPSADRYAVSDDYLRTMGIPLRLGRGFDAADGPGVSPVVLINETLARHVWPGEDAIGKRVRVGGTDGPPRTVVGVVGDVRHEVLDKPPIPQVYLPRAQWVDSSMVLVVRSPDPARLSGAVRAAIASVDPDQPVAHVETMERVMARSASSRRFSAGLLTAFAALASFLASVGIFGVISGFVGQRTREIGIRIALGADGGTIARLVSSRTLSLTLTGVGLGIVASLLLGRWLQSQLFEVTSRDPLVLLTGSALMVVVALAASAGPTRRATRVDPILALRSE